MAGQIFRSFILLVIVLFLGGTKHSKAAVTDSTTIKVHFLYGSRPLRQYKASEKKWFGGLKGGHVGIEIGNDSVFSFLPVCKLNIFPKRSARCGVFRIQSVKEFYEVLGGRYDSVKRTSVSIRINLQQKGILDSISASYLKKTPFDYAFFGMRCASTAYYILGKIGIVEIQSERLPWLRIFFPAILRHKLLHMAERRYWVVEKKEGSKKRRWERD